MLNSRGTVAVCVYDPVSGKSATYAEPWLCKPRQVHGTAAHQLSDSVQRSWNGATLYNDDNFAARLSNATDFSVTGICLDGASANIAFMKHIAAKHYELQAAGVLKRGDG